MTDRDRDLIRQRQANLRYLVNEWDPVGVSDLVDDEYECLLPPLWRLLCSGPTRAQVSEFLWTELEDHFGLEPHGDLVDPFADRLVFWSATWP